MEEKKIRPVQMLVNDLEEKVKDNKVSVEDFKNAFYEMQQAKFKVQQLLEYKLVSGSEKEYRELYNLISGENFSDLVDKLYESGRKKSKVLKEVISKHGYRLMEQTRAGKRDEVFHGLLRIFMSVDESFDKWLLSAFKSSNDEMFKVLIFSFLSGINN